MNKESKREKPTPAVTSEITPKSKKKRVINSGFQKEEVSAVIKEELEKSTGRLESNILIEAKNSGKLTIRWAVASIVLSFVISFIFQCQGSDSLKQMEKGINTGIKSFADSTLMATRRSYLEIDSSFRQNMTKASSGMKRDLELTSAGIMMEMKSEMSEAQSLIKDVDEKIEYQTQIERSVNGIVEYLGSKADTFSNYKSTNDIALVYKLRILMLHPQLKYDDIYSAFIKYQVGPNLIPNGRPTFRKWDDEIANLCKNAWLRLSQKRGRIEFDSLRYYTTYKDSSDHTNYLGWAPKYFTYEELAGFFVKFELVAKAHKMQMGKTRDEIYNLPFEEKLRILSE